MSQPSAIDILVEALTAVPEYDNPLNPLYEVLGREQSFPQRPLTLQAVRQHTQLLHDHADQARDQTFAVNKVIVSCKRIPPTPLPSLPLGF
ncbi:MAG: hypothetical protein M5U34_45005 [Chloroflexi bacterium]|nr:hypothetical protein [Chloroflexota bacterium]